MVLRSFWTQCTMRRTGPLMSRTSIAITWSARAIRSSLPTWVFSGANAKHSRLLPTFREDFIPDMIPTKIEVGTFVYENVAGMDAAIRYLEELGTRVSMNGRPISRRAALVRAMEAIRDYEATLSIRLLAGLERVKSNSVTVYGIRDSQRIHMRVPTVCFNVQGVSPAKVATKLAEMRYWGA